MPGHRQVKWGHLASSLAKFPYPLWCFQRVPDAAGWTERSTKSRLEVYLEPYTLCTVSMLSNHYMAFSHITLTALERVGTRAVIMTIV